MNVPGAMRPSLPADYAARATQLLAEQLPRIAQRAERSVLRVLVAAARADDGFVDDAVRSAAGAIQRAPDDALLEPGVASDDARLLDEAAHAAWRQRGSERQAVELQTRAFGADPADPRIAGGLAFLLLRQRQHELARQLALHALTLQDARHPRGRVEDWTTLAIASALSGRERDARHAWWVTLALADDVERQCRAALDAYAIYGEPVRPSVESMLHRLRDSGRHPRSALCEWPPHWAGLRALR